MSFPTISARINPLVTAALKQMFPNKTKGAEIAIDAFIYLRQAALSEIKGVFTQTEIVALVEALTGSKLVPEYQVNNHSLVLKIFEDEQQNNTLSNHKVEFSVLKDKIDRLTSSQVFFLQCEIYCYLNSSIDNQRTLLNRLF